MVEAIEIKKGFQKTEAGVIPNDWNPSTVGELIKFEGGSQPPLSTFSYVKHYNYIRLIQIRDYKTDKYSVYIPDRLARKKCNAYDIMIGRYGPPIFQILKGLDGAYNVALIKAIPSNKLNSEYALQFLKQKELFHFIEKLSQRSGGQTGIDIQELKKYPFPFPPAKAEQTAIATALNNADVLITQLEKLVAKKRAIKQGAMQELLKPKDGWVVKDLDLIADVIDPHPSHRAPTISSNGIPFAGIGDLSEAGELINTNVRKVSPNVFEEHSLRYNLADSLIGLGRVASIGKVINLKQLRFKYTISPTLGIIKPVHVDRGFLYQTLKHNTITNQFRMIMSGSTRSSVGMIVLRKLKISLPNQLPEQTRIAQILSDMDAEIEGLEKKMEKYKKIKQGMMQELLTGRIRLKKNV